MGRGAGNLGRMPEQVLTLVKLCLLALLYLFFAGVLRAVWAEVADGGRKTRSRVASVGVSTSAPAGATTSAAVPTPAVTAQAVRPTPTELIGKEPAEYAGVRYRLTEPVTVGRDPTSTIAVVDGFVSHHHARVFLDGGQCFVEDMSSTNGTFVNGSRIVGIAPLSVGDAVRCGNLVVEIG